MLEVGGTSCPAVSRGQLQPGDGGGAPECILWSLPPQLGLGLSVKAKTPTPEEQRAQPPPYFRCWEKLPTHSTPPLDSCPHSGSELGGRVRPSWETWSWSSSKVLTPAPLQRRFCLLPKGPCLLPTKVSDPSQTVPPPFLQDPKRNSGSRSGQERRRGSRSRVPRTSVICRLGASEKGHDPRDPIPPRLLHPSSPVARPL